MQQFGSLQFGSYFFSKIAFPRQHLFLKLIGGIKPFASSKIAVIKWCLNRADQAKNMSALKQLASIEKITEVHKSLRLSKITSSKSNGNALRWIYQSIWHGS